ncbi:unnamed protein product [Callosobruchus maculatus]|uniref:Uncharacterized protein n=1 Tax=Callosobruchus maculatus TaxID=64391 RepID=A0A653CHM6_CALMS|nr:unnamed protein product [Callosobruchus maculatus]
MTSAATPLKAPPPTRRAQFKHQPQVSQQSSVFPLDYTCVVQCVSIELLHYLSGTMSTTSLPSAVLLVLTAAVSLIAAYRVQPESDRSFDEEKRTPLLDTTPLATSLLSSANEYPDYQLGVRYDEYPLIVPKKRTALLVNRLIVALKEAMRNPDRTSKSLVNNDGLSYDAHKSYLISPEDVRSMDLQRRGHGAIGEERGRKLWRCYFNAVTCF